MFWLGFWRGEWLKIWQKATHLSQPFPSSSSFFSFFSSPLLLPQPQGVKNCHFLPAEASSVRNVYTCLHTFEDFSQTPSSSPSTWSIPCPPSPPTTRIAGKTSIAARSNRDWSGITRPTELDAVQVRPPFSHASDPSSALWCRAFGGAGGADITVSPAKGPISARKIKTTSRTSRSKPSRQAQTPTTPTAFQRSRIVRLPP